MNDNIALLGFTIIFICKISLVIEITFPLTFLFTDERVEQATMAMLTLS